jgi:cytoskeletal protein CcmA (bactofilin family)
MAVNTASGFRPDQENVAYIGAGVTIKGEISVPDLIVIDGTIEGNVTARVVCVGQSGVIRGNISATEADISGTVSDHVEARQLLLVRATGRVEGRVMYGEIELEKGAVVTGDLSATDDYRAVPKTGSGKGAAQERGELEALPPPSRVASGAGDRLTDAVRGAKNGPTKAPIYIAGEAEPPRRTLLRPPLSGRRVSN